MINDIKVGLLYAVSSIRRGNRKTTIFIILVLALIFMNLVFLPSLIGGVVGAFTYPVRNFAYGDILVEPTAENVYINNADNVLAKIRSVNDVHGAAKRLDSGASLRYKQHIVGANIIGVVPDDERGVSRYPYVVVQGEFLDAQSEDEILLGAIIADVSLASGLYETLEGVAVGSRVNVTYSNGVERSYRVRGFIEGGMEITDLGAVVHYKELESVLGLDNQDKASTIIVRVDENQENILRKKLVSFGVKEPMSTWQEKSEVLMRQALQSIGVLGVMSKIVSLIVGAALIFIVVYINTLNRKKEIGILKAIGISPLSIVISYIFISLFYVVLGTLLGLMLFGIIILYLQANPLIFFETMEVVPKVDPTFLIQSIATMIGLGVVAGILPAWLVARQDMLEAIWGR